MRKIANCGRRQKSFAKKWENIPKLIRGPSAWTNALFFCTCPQVMRSMASTSFYTLLKWNRTAGLSLLLLFFLLGKRSYFTKMPKIDFVSLLSYCATPKRLVFLCSRIRGANYEGTLKGWERGSTAVPECYYEGRNKKNAFRYAEMDDNSAATIGALWGTAVIISDEWIVTKRRALFTFWEGCQQFCGKVYGIFMKVNFL